MEDGEPKRIRPLDAESKCKNPGRSRNVNGRSALRGGARHARYSPASFQIIERDAAVSFAASSAGNSRTRWLKGSACTGPS